MSALPRAWVDEALFSFLESIYLFEKRESDLFGLSWDEVYLLQLLKRKGLLRVSEAALLLRVEAFKITRRVTRLAELGLVRRESHTEDRRVVLLRITDTGLQRLQEVEDFNYQLVSSEDTGITLEQKKMLLELFSQLGLVLGLK